MVCCVCVGHGAGTLEERRGLESSSKSVCKALNKKGITAKIAIIDNNIQIPKCDFVFNLCDNDEGNPDSFIQFTEYLEASNILFTGNTSESFKLHYDKYNWSAYFQIKRHLPKRGITFSYKDCFTPIIVKHRFSHGSLYPIKTFRNFLHPEIFSLLKTKNYYWEHFIEGKELTVACLPNETYYISERKQDDSTILDFKAKWHGSSELTMSFVTDCIKERVERIVKDVRTAFNITSYMRLDLRVSSTEQIFLIDINPNCSLDPNGAFCKTLRIYNISYERVISMLSSNFLGTYL